MIFLAGYLVGALSVMALVVFLAVAHRESEVERANYYHVDDTPHHFRSSPLRETAEGIFVSDDGRSE